MPSGVYDRTNWKPWNVGIKHSKESIEKMRASKKGVYDGSNNPNWKGGVYINKLGYYYVYSPKHPNADCRKYVKRCNLVMEKHINRFLNSKEVVHHKGIKHPINSRKNRQDDRIENLELFSNESEHQKLHIKLRKINQLGQLIPVTFESY